MFLMNLIEVNIECWIMKKCSFYGLKKLSLIKIQKLIHKIALYFNSLVLPSWSMNSTILWTLLHTVPNCLCYSDISVCLQISNNENNDMPEPWFEDQVHTTIAFSQQWNLLFIHHLPIRKRNKVSMFSIYINCDYLNLYFYIEIERMNKTKHKLSMA